MLFAANSCLIMKFHYHYETQQTTIEVHRHCETDNLSKWLQNLSKNDVEGKKHAANL